MNPRDRQSPDGDIIDCVHLSNQPAFDHPFLKNHTIQVNFLPQFFFLHLLNSSFFINQMRPSFILERNNEVKNSENLSTGKSSSISQMWHLSGKCPENTVPIRRTKEEDLLRVNSARRYGKKTQRNPRRPASDSDTINNSGHQVKKAALFAVILSLSLSHSPFFFDEQHAIAYVEGDKYYGAKATINVWNPKIQQPNEFSLSQFWILGGPLGGDFNSIEAGWQVLLH